MLGQTSPAAAATLSFAAPTLTGATSGPLPTFGATLTLAGANLGGAGVLFINGAPVGGGGGLGTPSADHAAMTFALPALPAAVVGAASVTVAVGVGGVLSNGVAVPLVPPTLVANGEPIAALTAPAAAAGCSETSGLTGGTPAVAWLDISGSCFGGSGGAAATVDIVVGGSLVVGSAPCVVCNRTDTVITCATNASSGSLVVRVGALASAPPAIYSLDALLQVRLFIYIYIYIYMCVCVRRVQVCYQPLSGHACVLGLTSFGCRAGAGNCRSARRCRWFAG